jgi:uncharacterized protein (DUF433 family)
MTEDEFLRRITFDPSIFGGKPIVRGRRLAVEHVLGMLAAGDSFESLRKGYPWLEEADIRACLAYARRLVGHEGIDPCLEITGTGSRSRSLAGPDTLNPVMTELLARITIDPEQCGGRPCIRGLRVRVTDVLEWLAAGETIAQILAQYPYLEAEDISAALLYAARRLDHPTIAA